MYITKKKPAIKEHIFTFDRLQRLSGKIITVGATDLYNSVIQPAIITKTTGVTIVATTDSQYLILLLMLIGKLKLRLLLSSTSMLHSMKFKEFLLLRNLQLQNSLNVVISIMTMTNIIFRKEPLYFHHLNWLLNLFKLEMIRLLFDKLLVVHEALLPLLIPLLVLLVLFFLLKKKTPPYNTHYAHTIFFLFVYDLEQQKWHNTY